MYQNIEVRISSVYDEKGQKMSDDYKNIIFKDIQHEQSLGRKYLFDIHNFSQTDNSKKSVWLNTNFDVVKLGANAILRKCTGNLGFLVNGNTEEWYEPTILDYDSKYTINYYHDTLNIVKSELYATAQFNEYTKNIEVNDRFILGALDFDNVSNNSVYKVKEVFKFGAEHTLDPNSIPLIILALDRDIIDIEKDLVCRDTEGNMHYIADFYLKQSKDNNATNLNEYFLKIEPNQNIIYEGNSIVYSCYVYDNLGNKIEAPIEFSTELKGTSIPTSYYNVNIIDDNNIEITNIHKYFKSDLVLHCKAILNNYNIKPLSFAIELGERI